MRKYVKIDISKYFIKNIEVYNQIQKLKDNLHSYVEREDILDVLNKIDFGVPGVEEEIISKHLIRVAKRAIELNDQELLDALSDLYIVGKD